MQEELIRHAGDTHPVVSRRVFFKRVGAVVLGGALFLGGRFTPAALAAPRIDSTYRDTPSTPNNAPDIRAPLERTVFASHLGETFIARSGGMSVIPLELIAVHAAGQAAVRPSLDTHTFENCFSIVFRGAHSLPQGTYTFSHPQMGSFPLFIVPMTQDKASFTFQALFHRLPA